MGAILRQLLRNEERYTDVSTQLFRVTWCFPTCGRTLNVFADGFSYGVLRDALVMTYARLLIQTHKTVIAVSNTVRKWLAAGLSGGGRVAAAGSALGRTFMRG
jgi:hypothetical protein